MSDIGDAIQGVRSELNTAAPEIFPDVCDVFNVTNTTDAFGEPVPVITTVVSGVPCKSQAMGSSEQIIAEGEQTTLSHKLKMGITPSTVMIKPNYRIVMAANGDVPEQTFENPTSLIDSFSPFMVLAANLRQL